MESGASLKRVMNWPLNWSGLEFWLSVMGLVPGIRMKAFVAAFLTFRDGKIVAQRNYDCHPPSEAQADPAV
jgi:hypothetical protein